MRGTEGITGKSETLEDHITQPCQVQIYYQEILNKNRCPRTSPFDKQYAKELVVVGTTCIHNIKEVKEDPKQWVRTCAMTSF